MKGVKKTQKNRRLLDKTGGQWKQGDDGTLSKDKFRDKMVVPLSRVISSNIENTIVVSQRKHVITCL